MKNARKRQRAKEKDFPKKKRKVGKEKRAPDNATVVSFKAQKVFVPTQLNKDETQPSTYRKQSLQDLLRHLSHPSPSIRCDSLNGLRTLFSSHPSSLLPCLGKLFHQLSPIFIDQDSSVRHALLLLTKFLLTQVPSEHLAPFFPILMVSVKCGLTHINSAIQQDTLKVMDLLINHSAPLLRSHASEILPLYIPLMSCGFGGQTKASSSNHKSKTASNSKLKSTPSGSFSHRLKVLDQLLHFLSLLCLPMDTNDKASTNLISSSLTLPSAPVLNIHQQLVWPSHEDFLLSTNSKDMVDFLSSSLLYTCLDPSVQVTVQGHKKCCNSAPLFPRTEEFGDFCDRLIQLLLECWVEVAPSCLLNFSSSIGNKKQRSNCQPSNLLETVLQLLCVLLKLVSETHGKSELRAFSLQASSSTTLLISIGEKHCASFKTHFMTYFPLFEDSGESSPISLLMNIRLCYLMLALCSHTSSTISYTTIFSYLTVSLPRASSVLDSQQLQSYTAILVSLLEMLYSQNNRFRQGYEGEEKGLLRSAVLFFRSCHPQSSAKQTFLVYLEQLMATAVTSPESKSSLVETDLLQPCLATIPELLLLLPRDTAPSVFKLLIELLRRAISCSSQPTILAFHTRLAALLSPSGLLSYLPESLQSMLLHLVGHIRLTPSSITFLANLISDGALPHSHAVSLLHTAHHKLLSIAEEAKYSTPGVYSSLIASDVSFLLCVLIGYSQKQLQQMQLPLSDSYTLLPSQSAITESTKTNLAKAVVQCLFSLPLSKPQLFKILQPSLEQLLSSTKCLPCDAVYAVLWLVTVLATELSNCLTILLAEVVLSCLVAMETSTPPNDPLIGCCYRQSVSVMSACDDVTSETVKLMGNVTCSSFSGKKNAHLYCNSLINLLCDPLLETTMRKCSEAVRATAGAVMSCLSSEDSDLKERLEISMSNVMN